MEAIRKVSGAPAPVGAYSPAVKAAGLVFCSGQIAIDPETNQLVSGGVAQQAKQVFKNLAAVLEASGSSVDKIVMSSIFLAEIADAKEINGLYSDFIEQSAPPARQTLAVKDLPLGALIEISVIAEC
jgi:2-iminobutanoate/2-iminopropanoate deaminase